RRLHAALPNHPLVVTGELARASEPQGMMAVELLLSRLDPPLDRTVLARCRIDLRGDRNALAGDQGDPAEGVDEILEAFEVDHRIVLDFEPGDRGHCIHGRLLPRELRIFELILVPLSLLEH